MTDKLEKLFKFLQGFKLSSSERDTVRAEILKFINESELGAPRHIQQRPLIYQSKFQFWQVKKRIFSMPALIVALIIMFSGGTAIAANSSLPGDALYPVKIEVNERIGAAFHLSADSQADFRLKLAEKRLAEAEELAASGRLDAAIIARLQANFSAQEERMKALIAKFEAAGSDDKAARLSSNLEAALSAHERILINLEAKVESGEKLVDPVLIEGLLENVRIKLNSTTKIRVDSENGVKDESRPEEFRKVAAEKVIAMTERSIVSVKELIAKVEAELGAEAVAEAKLELAEAESTLADAKVKFEAGSFAEAFILAQKAHRQAIEARHELRFRSEVRIEI